MTQTIHTLLLNTAHSTWEKYTLLIAARGAPWDSVQPCKRCSICKHAQHIMSYLIYSSPCSPHNKPSHITGWSPNSKFSSWKVVLKTISGCALQLLVNKNHTRLDIALPTYFLIQISTLTARCKSVKMRQDGNLQEPATDDSSQPQQLSQSASSHHLHLNV